MKSSFEKFNDLFFKAQRKMSCFEIQQRQRRFFHSMVKKITFYELYMQVYMFHKRSINFVIGTKGKQQTILHLWTQYPSLRVNVRLRWTFVLIQASFAFLWKLPLKNTSQHKNRQVCIETRSPPASLPSITVKWTITKCTPILDGFSVEFCHVLIPFYCF